MNDESECVVTLDGAKRWYLNGQEHRLDGPAIIYSNGVIGWRIHGQFVFAISLELSIGQSFPWGDSIALVIKQTNSILFQILVGNKKEYIFSTYKDKQDE